MEGDSASHSIIDVAAAIERAAALLATEPANAERQARRALAAAPRDPRAALILASARRRQGDPAAAAAILEPLARSFPQAAQTHYELGASLAALGEHGRALAALRHATFLNPDIAEAWRVLGDLLFRKGEAAAAEVAFAEHARACVTDPRLQPAARALFSGRLDEAEALLRDHARARPDDLTGLHLLAQACAGLNRFADAERLLAHCLERDPGFDAARFSYASALFHQQKGAAALPHVERLLAASPDKAAYRNLLAACLGLVGEHTRVLEVHEGLLADYPEQPRIWLNYGHGLRTVGRGDEAAEAYRRCIALSPALGEAWWSLANLKTAQFAPEDVAALAILLARTDIADEDRLHFHYALGKALEDRGDHVRAFEHYAAGARLRRARAAYDADATSARARRAKALFSREFLAARSGAGAVSNAPIFIVGLPRAGSTLVEQILASHPAVEGSMELPDIGFIAERLDGRAGCYPERLADLNEATLTALGETYLETTRIHRKLGRPFFIDKMPNNFQHLGLIQLILPNAKIIDVRRHPMAAGFAVFKQHFAQGQAFSYDLADIGRYYRDYVELMAHFDRVMPGRVHRVIYEDLVEDPETEIRRLLAYCGLPFEAACLRFYETDRAVRTVSSEQVRRPIYRDGLERWRAYEPWLGELKAALGPSLETWRGNKVATEICA